MHNKGEDAYACANEEYAYACMRQWRIHVCPLNQEA